MSATDETRIRRGDPLSAGPVPADHAPPPRRANHRSPNAGAESTPTCSSPSRSQARRVPKSGIPRMKLWVPSIGSTYQRTDASAWNASSSSPTMP